MKQIEAKGLIKTLNWIAQAGEDNRSVLAPTLNKRGIYECAIYLPIIDKTIVGIGDYKIESIDNATKEAAIYIDKYLAENPSITLEDKFDDSDYFLEEDDDGYLCLRLTENRVYN